MTINELKGSLFKIVGNYFAGATVVWESTEKTKPDGSLVTLRLGSVKYSQHYIEQTSDNGEIYYKIPSSVVFSVQLFTHGKKVVVDGSTYFENTALDDMIDFVKYATSGYAIQLCEKYDISITASGTAKDATAASDPNYEYRAFQDFTVDFMQETKGFAGISRDDWSQTPSGGGTEELAGMPIDDIDYNGIGIKNKI